MKYIIKQPEDLCKRTGHTVTEPNNRIRPWQAILAKSADQTAGTWKQKDMQLLAQTVTTQQM